MQEKTEDEIRSILHSLIDNIVYTQDCNTWPELILSDVRKTKSISSLDSSDVGDLSSFTDSETELDEIQSVEDSEEEFKQYLRKTKSRRQKSYVKEHCWNLDPKRARTEREKRGVQDEYALLPDISNVSIKCSDKSRLVKLGVIQNIVGCAAMVKPTGVVNQILDLDTILFSKNKEAVGAICDVVGTVKLPIYCFKLDSSAPKDSVAVGTELYYAPADTDCTKKLIDVILPTPWDKEDQSDEDVVFSDDEKEMRHLASKLANGAVMQVKQQHNATARKRNNNNHRVHFQQPNNENQQLQQQNKRNPHTSDATHSQPKKRGGRGRRRGNGPDHTYQDRPRQMNTFQPSRNTSYVQENQNRPKPLSTNDNPYAEFGCYDNFATDDARRNVYRRM